MFRDLRRKIRLLLLIALTGCTAAAASSADTLEVLRTNAGYVLKVPVSKVVLTVPDSTLVDVTQEMRKSSSDRRYFYLVDQSRGLTASGWFEQADDFNGLAAFWKEEVASWKQNSLPPPTKVSAVKVGQWQAIFYDIEEGQDPGVHVRAELVLAGTWVDLHLSISKREATNPTREALETFLKSVVVDVLPGG